MNFTQIKAHLFNAYSLKMYFYAYLYNFYALNVTIL